MFRILCKTDIFECPVYPGSELRILDSEILGTESDIFFYDSTYDLIIGILKYI